MMVASSDRTLQLDANRPGDAYYRDLQRRNLLRLLLTYLAPLVILAAYFYFQSRSMMLSSTRSHLRLVAENHAKAMDLFLQERVVNLANIIDDPRLEVPPPPAVMTELLARLRRASDVFEDLGFIDDSGKQPAYEGPYRELKGQYYGSESWLVALRNGKADFIVTDRYNGLRGKPHFTLAVGRRIGGRYVAVRAALDPDRLFRYFSSIAEDASVELVAVNAAGHRQLMVSTGESDDPQFRIVPPTEPRLAAATLRTGWNTMPYAYAWMNTCNWAVIVTPSARAGPDLAANLQIDIIAFSAAVIGLTFSVIYVRARRIVQGIRREDAARAQLTDNLLHASRLAAVGELAAGIAHEINNPLAIINEETGLIKDMADPRFNLDVSLQDCVPHLDAIQDAVSRCRSITGKLLAFVRREEVSLARHNLHRIIDGIVDSFYGRGLADSNIAINRNYCRDDLHVLADKTQLEQVFLNIINNALDAVDGKGTITISTTLLWQQDRVRIDVEDTGIGMTQGQLEKIFLPFYTTKQEGKGTGLGLSISYAIIKNMAGEISVTSVPGEGSKFSIELPVQFPEGGARKRP